MKIKRTLWIVLLLALACSKETVEPRSYPRVLTTGVSDVTATSAYFQGEIFYTSVPVLDYGFVWTDAGFPTYEASNKISLGTTGAASHFNSTATGTFIEGKRYTFRAFAKSEHNLVYGASIDFFYVP